MGRRSTNTTKSGKFMNPTDQARKEARKRELKKNKKQRKLVRETVLKLKDPVQIIEEMLRLDLLELEGLSDNVNEKVVAEKKKKLLETLTRILNLYEKTDKEKYAEIRKFQVECDRKRHKAYVVYQSARQKEQDEIDRKNEEEEPSFNLLEIALPHSGKLAPDEIPLPTPMTLPGIQPPEMKKHSTHVSEDNIPHIPGLPPGLIPPGPPPGSPPNSPGYLYEEDIDGKPADGEPLESKEPGSSKEFDIDPIAELERLESEFHTMEQNEKRFEEEFGAMDDSDDDYDDDDDHPYDRKRKVHFEGDEDDEHDGGPMTMQKRLLRLAGHDPKQMVRQMLPPGAPPGLPPGAPPGLPTGLPPGPPPLLPGPPPGAPPGPPPGVPPRGMPPGPPPGRPPGPPPGLPPRPPPGLPPLGLPPRLPPGIPMPGMRPPFLPPSINPPMFNPQLDPTAGAQTVIEKGPEIKKIDKEDGSSVISAKPQLRNIRAEVTKFVPTAVKIHRNTATMKRKQLAKPFVSNEKTEADKAAEKQHSEPTKDDVYAKFMNEMTGFL